MWRPWHKDDEHISSDEHVEMVTDDNVEFLDDEQPSIYLKWFKKSYYFAATC